jgi:hypothetical protein
MARILNFDEKDEIQGMKRAKTRKEMATTIYRGGPLLIQATKRAPARRDMIPQTENERDVTAFC